MEKEQGVKKKKQNTKKENLFQKVLNWIGSLVSPNENNGISEEFKREVAKALKECRLKSIEDSKCHRENNLSDTEEDMDPAEFDYESDSDNEDREKVQENTGTEVGFRIDINNNSLFHNDDKGRFV